MCGCILVGHVLYVHHQLKSVPNPFGKESTRHICRPWEVEGVRAAFRGDGASGGFEGGGGDAEVLESSRVCM